MELIPLLVQPKKTKTIVLKFHLQLVIDELKNTVLNKLQSIFKIGNNNLIISDKLSLEQQETLVSITKDAGDASRKLNLILDG